MTTPSAFYYPVTMHRDAASSQVLAPVVSTLPLVQSVEDLVVILLHDVGAQPQGLYVFDGVQWRFAMPMPAISASIIFANSLDVYLNETLDVTLPSTVMVYKNGQLQPGDEIVPGSAVYAVRTPPTGGSAGAVTSVNGQTGAVTVNASNLPGLSVVGRTGNYTDLIGAPGPYTLPAATTSVLGGVIVSSSNLMVDSSGNLDISATLSATINGKLGNAASVGGGVSLINAITAGTLNLRSLQAGTNVTLNNNAGVITIAVANLTPATSTALGGVIVPVSSNLTVDGAGNIDVSAALLATIGGKLSSVVSSGTGTSLINSLTAGVATLKSLTAGTNVTIIDDGNGNLTFSAAGGVGSVTLTGDVTGSGSGSIATTLANSGVTAGTYTKVTVNAKGLITASGTLALSDITTALGFTPYNATNPSGYISANQAITVSGDATGSGSTAITLTLANSGVVAGTYAKVTVNAKGLVTGSAALASADVTTALGYTPYNGTTNPSGFLTTNQTITASGDVSGSGTTTLALTLATSGVTAGTYTKVTVDAKGRVTVGAALGSTDVTTALGFTPYNGGTNPNGFLTGNQAITISGDATGTGTTTVALTLAASGVAVGTYKSVTVDAKGRVTAGSNPTTLAGFGITDALNATSGGTVGGTITLTSGATLTGLPAPVANGDATNKIYVDNAIASVTVGTTWKANAQVTTTGTNITLSGLQTLDGYTTLAGDRVLVKDQTDQTTNGVYVAAAGVWSRAVDVSTGAEVEGMAILVINGTANSLTQWVNTNSTPVTIGTTNITYTKLQGNGVVYSAGTGLTLTGQVFSITNTGVTAGTYPKVTVNAQGQVTSGAALASTDVTTALGFTPYSASNPNGYISSNQAITLSGDATGTGTSAITVTLAASGVAASTYNNVTVNAKGIVTAGSNVAYLTANQTITASGDVTGSGTTTLALTLANSGVTAGTYTKVTVDAKGRVTTGASLAAADVNTALGYTAYNGTTNPSGFLTANQTITASGDVTGSGSTSLPLTLAASGVTAGTYKSVTVDAKGRVTAGSNPTTLAGFGITDALGAATGGSLTGTITLSGAGLITGVPTPVNPSDAVNKSYTDGVGTATFNSVSWKSMVQAATTANITLSGLQAIDGYTTLAGDRILVKNQTVGSANGIYLANAGAWTRSADSATAATIQNQALIVLQGTTQALTQWANTNVGAITLGTTSITYGQTSSAGTSYTAGTGLTLTGSVFSITNTAVTPGTYTKVTVNAQGQVTAGTSVTSLDVTTALGFSPVPLGGGTMTGALNFAPVVTVASAATTPIGVASSNTVNITGTTTITAFDNVLAGSMREVTFTGILTLTYNATSLILPTGASITTAAGDTACFTSLGSGNWRCLYYTRANGTALTASPDATKLPLAGGTLSGALNQAPTVTLASAATVAIGAAAANDISVTGTTTITAFDTIAAGAVRSVTFTGILTLTYNVSSLILPGSANITTQVGDTAEFTSLGGGNWRCNSYTKRDGTPLIGATVFNNGTFNGFIEGGATASGTAFAPDFTIGTDFEYTLTGNATITLPAPVAGRSYTITVIYTGVFTPTFAGGGTIKYTGGGTAPTPTSVNGKRDYYVCKCDRTGTYTTVFDGGRNA